MQVIDSVATNAGAWAPEFEHFLRTQSHRPRFATCARGSRASDTEYASLVLLQTCIAACMLAWANLRSSLHRRLRGLRKPWRRCRAMRFACDQHDHVSFAKAWVLMSKGVGYALDYDFRLVPPAVMAPLQRRLEGGLRQTMSVLLGNEVSELAWERAKLSTCFGGLGIRVAQEGFAAQATYWSAVDLHTAVVTGICEALRRPLQAAHPEEGGDRPGCRGRPAQSGCVCRCLH